MTVEVNCHMHDSVMSRADPGLVNGEVKAPRVWGLGRCCARSPEIFLDFLPRSGAFSVHSYT